MVVWIDCLANKTVEFKFLNFGILNSVKGEISALLDLVIQLKSKKFKPNSLIDRLNQLFRM